MENAFVEGFNGIRDECLGVEWFTSKRLRMLRIETYCIRLQMGNLHLLDGGMNAWHAARMTVNRRAKRMSLERQVRITDGPIVATSAIVALAINPLFAVISAAIGSGLVVAGLTDVHDGECFAPACRTIAPIPTTPIQ